MHEDGNVASSSSSSNEQKKTELTESNQPIVPILEDEIAVGKEGEITTTSIEHDHYNNVTADEGTAATAASVDESTSTTNKQQHKQSEGEREDDDEGNDEEMTASVIQKDTDGDVTISSDMDVVESSDRQGERMDTDDLKEEPVSSENSSKVPVSNGAKDNTNSNHNSTTTTVTATDTAASIENKTTNGEARKPNQNVDNTGTTSSTSKSKSENEHESNTDSAVDSTTAKPSSVAVTDVDADADASTVKMNNATTTNAETSQTTIGTTNTEAAPDVVPIPPPPVMKGTLCVDLTPQRRHLIRGMWNYENSTTFPSQRFELVRNLNPDEDIYTLPVDGEFHGSFSLAYFHTTSKGKQKERSKIIPETGVMIKFIKDDDAKESGTYKVEGTGTNQFGIFHIYGTATHNPKITTDSSTMNDTPTMSIVFRKRYEPGLVVATATTTSNTDDVMNVSIKSNRSDSTYTQQHASEDGTSTGAAAIVPGPLPDPAISFPSGVVALRGKLYKEESNDLGSTEVVHRINGTWASGLDYIEADPQNLRGLCNRFEYEHKSAVPTQQFPVSGKYSGWFDLSNEDGTRTRINERDVSLKFRMNNKGYQNVEGKGSNVFGKYTITGTLTSDNIITIFRHFQPRKLKKSTSTNNTAPLNDSTVTASSVTTIEPNTALSTSTVNPNLRRSLTGMSELKLSLDDVIIPSIGTGNDTEPYDPIVPPVAGTYSAVSRGVLRINDDGSHSCQGKWAATREHFTNGQTSSFTFRLEPHFVAQESMNEGGGGSTADKFPLDSSMYKGSFQLKKQGSRYQTIIDQQIVMKFKRNKQGAFNVHGTGINAIGEFNLLGTLVTSGKSGGQVELYRMYPPEKLAVQPVTANQTTQSSADIGSAGSAQHKLMSSMAVATSTITTSSTTTSVKQQQQHQLQRRESSRMIKLPSRLEEDDPDAQLSRTMDKCLQLLKFMKERDVELGGFFGEAVDPVALGIPSYLHIIKEPMDLGTIDRRMEIGAIETPEEFARLVRLVFENAMTFNVDPGHSVHQAARNLLVIFNQKFRDVERMVQSIRRTHGIDVDDTGKPKGKDDKKNKRQDEPKSMKRLRLEEAQAMTASNATAISAVVAAMPTTNLSTVTRNEFSLLFNLVKQLQHQIVQTHLAVAELCSGDTNDDGNDPLRTGNSSSHNNTSKTTTSASVPEKKKAVKRKAEVEAEYVPPIETSLPLTEKEQELLMETINSMPQEHLEGVLEIVREAAPFDENDEEIDLGIDQLDVVTLRKLFRHVQMVSINRMMHVLFEIF
jgi:hypothetical protein